MNTSFVASWAGFSFMSFFSALVYTQRDPFIWTVTRDYILFSSPARADFAAERCEYCMYHWGVERDAA